RTRKRERYDDLVAESRLAPVDSAEAFRTRTTEVREAKSDLDAKQRELSAEKDPLALEHRDLKQQSRAIAEEISSLEERRNNLPQRLVTIRRDLSATLGIDEEELPFAGELIEVSDEHAP